MTASHAGNHDFRMNSIRNVILSVLLLFCLEVILKIMVAIKEVGVKVNSLF